MAKIRALVEAGDFDAAATLLAPLVLLNAPEAIYLRSRFALHGDSESIEAFEARAFEQLRQAAELGWPAAMFELSVSYRYGDAMTGIDLPLADLWEARAAESGHPVE